MMARRKQKVKDKSRKIQKFLSWKMAFSQHLLPAGVLGENY